LTPDYWNRQIERWMDIFTDDEPDLMGLELVREFDNLAEKFYGTLANDFNEYTESEIHIGFSSTVVRSQSSPFPEGIYKVLYTVHDEPSGNTFEITKDVTISPSSSA
jgi:hypothetical protein